MTKILGIAGSPRRNGNTQLLLDEALKGARKAGARTEKIVLNDLNISPCRECGACSMTGMCAIGDEMQTVYKKLKNMDGIIIASPIFFMNMSAQTKTMIDRCQSIWASKYLLKKPIAKKKRKGIFIAVGATNFPDMFRAAKKTVQVLFDVIDVDYSDELLISGIDEKGAIEAHPTAMRDAFEAGGRLVRKITESQRDKLER
jgi:multimeric flavodoxin WrbA